METSNSYEFGSFSFMVKETTCHSVPFIILKFLQKYISVYFLGTNSLRLYEPLCDKNNCNINPRLVEGLLNNFYDNRTYLVTRLGLLIVKKNKTDLPNRKL